MLIAMSIIDGCDLSSKVHHRFLLNEMKMKKDRFQLHGKNFNFINAYEYNQEY